MKDNSADGEPVFGDAANAPDASARLQHYQLLSRLGSGGYGEVFEAFDTRLRRKVAIKRMNTMASGHLSGGLFKEARLAASLHHPAFVKVYSIEEDGREQAIIMELIAGKTWRELIANGETALDRTLDIVRQLALAMEAAHETGLVHGDLKPSNLMLDTDGKVRVLDFGLAFHDDPQATSSVLRLEQQGTIAYMAPEQLLGAPPSRASDIYAVGVILYELATGQRPHGALAGLALAAAQMQSSSASWNFPHTLPVEIVDLIRAMTASPPEHRLGSMREIVSRLDGRPWRRPMPPLPRRWLFRTRMSLVAAAVAGLGFVAWHFVPTQVWHTASNASFSTSAVAAQALQALREYDRPDRLDVAAKDFRQILEYDADNAAAVAGMSLLYSFRYAGDGQDETWLQLAAAGAQQALKLDRQLALGHVAQAWVLSNQGKTEQALAKCEDALKLEPNSFFAFLGKAIFLTTLRRYDDAKAWLAQARHQFPKEHAFLDSLGTIAYRQGDYASAERAFRMSIALQPDSVTAYANLNAALLREDRGDEALQVLQQGLRVRPTSRLYANLGNALFLRGDYVGAADAFEQAVTPPAGNPNSYLGWANLADTLLLLPGRSALARDAYLKAKRLLEPALRRAPQDVTLVSRMSLYCARLGEADASMRLLSQAVAMAPQSPDVHFRAGLAYELLGRREPALKEIATAKSLGIPPSAIDSEPDLVSLRRDVRYR